MNNSLVDLLINSTGGEGDWTSTLGRCFLTAAYLMFDHDSNTFTLWQANPSTGTPNLVLVLDGEWTEQSCAVNGNSGDGGGGATTSTPSTAETADTPPPISIGAVVGIAIGGVGGLAAVAVALFLRGWLNKQGPSRWNLQTATRMSMQRSTC